MIRHLKKYGILLAFLGTLSSCSTLNRWEEHKKENTEPANPQIEAPFNQIPDPGRDDPYKPNAQAFGELSPELPKVQETMFDPTKPNVLYGIPLEGKPGFVLSPYAPDRGMVDVTGFPPETDVRDPYTGQIMRVPPIASTNAGENPNEETLSNQPGQTPEPIIPQIEN